MHVSDTEHYVIEYSIDAGKTWEHGRTVPAWVVADKTALAGQREVVRDNARETHGNVERVITRYLADDDPRGVLNQPPAPADPDNVLATFARKHHAEFRAKEYDGTEEPWSPLGTFTGPDSYATAVARGRRFADANRGGNTRVRVRREEVLDTFEC